MPEEEHSESEEEFDVEEARECILEEIFGCYNCQPYDEWVVWLGPKSEIQDILMNCDIDDIHWDEVLEDLRCPSCGTELTSQYDEVEVKSEYDKKVDARLREAKKPEIIQQLRVFHDFLSLYPYLGLADPAGTGKHIFDTVGAWPRVQLNSQEWYRARLIDQESRIFCSDEMCSPDPVKVSIKEGRYNHTGQSFLYLADSQDTAFNEIKRNKENICAMQKFVPDEPINVLDLTPHLGDLDLNMDMMALAIIYNGYVNKHPDYDSSWKPEYFVPRFIADCARLNSYDGILFSSAVSFGNNLVVFEEKRDLFKSNGPCEIYKWEKRTNGIMMSFFGYDDLLE